MDLIERNVHNWDIGTKKPKLNSEKTVRVLECREGCHELLWKGKKVVLTSYRLGCCGAFGLPWDLLQALELSVTPSKAFSLFTQTLLYLLRFFLAYTSHGLGEVSGRLLTDSGLTATLFGIYPPLAKTMKTKVQHLGSCWNSHYQSCLGEVQRVHMGWLNRAQTLGISLSSAVHRDNGQPLAWIYETPAFSVLTFANERAEYSC